MKTSELIDATVDVIRRFGVISERRTGLVHEYPIVVARSLQRFDQAPADKPVDAQIVEHLALMAPIAKTLGDELREDRLTRRAVWHQNDKNSCIQFAQAWINQTRFGVETLVLIVYFRSWNPETEGSADVEFVQTLARATAAELGICRVDAYLIAGNAHCEVEYMNGRSREKEKVVVGEMTVNEAGRRGGTQTSTKHGREYFVALGKMGGRAMSEKYGHEFFSEIGTKGGFAVKARRGVEFFSTIGKMGGAALHAKYGTKFLSEIGTKGGKASKRRKTPTV